MEAVSFAWTGLESAGQRTLRVVIHGYCMIPGVDGISGVEGDGGSVASEYEQVMLWWDMPAECGKCIGKLVPS